MRAQENRHKRVADGNRHRNNMQLEHSKLQLVMIAPETKGMTLTGESVHICKKRKRYWARKAKARFRASRVRT